MTAAGLGELAAAVRSLPPMLGRTPVAARTALPDRAESRAMDVLLR